MNTKFYKKEKKGKKKLSKIIDTKGKKWYNIQAYNYYGYTLTSFQKSNVEKYGGVIIWQQKDQEKT